jgi:hypothetical protein
MGRPPHAQRHSKRWLPSADHDASYQAPPVRGSTRHNASTPRKFPILLNI